MVDQVCLFEILILIFKGLLYIDNFYEEGDQCKYYVGCLYCGEVQILEWLNVKWDKVSDGIYLLEIVYYECCVNGCIWDDDDRVEVIKNVEVFGYGWKVSKLFCGYVFYYLSELYFCFVGMKDVVQFFLDKKVMGDFQIFVNVFLVEVWEEDVEMFEVDQLIVWVVFMFEKIFMGVVLQICGVDM